MKSYRSLGVVLLALLSCFSIALGADLVHLSVDQAKQEGLTDGNSDGGREGSERGPQEGREQGLDAGRRAGFEKCSQEAHQNNFERTDFAALMLMLSETRLQLELLKELMKQSALTLLTAATVMGVLQETAKPMSAHSIMTIREADKNIEKNGTRSPF